MYLAPVGLGLGCYEGEALGTSYWIADWIRDGILLLFCECVYRPTFWDLRKCEEAKLIHRGSHPSSSWLLCCDGNGRDGLQYDRLLF
jgi:hypothetical protein